MIQHIFVRLSMLKIAKKPQEFHKGKRYKASPELITIKTRNPNKRWLTEICVSHGFSSDVPNTSKVAKDSWQFIFIENDKLKEYN